MKNLKDISVVFFVPLLCAVILGWAIHTFSNYKYCEREHNCKKAIKTEKGIELTECDIKICNTLPRNLDDVSKPYSPPEDGGLR